MLFILPKSTYTKNFKKVKKNKSKNRLQKISNKVQSCFDNEE